MFDINNIASTVGNEVSKFIGTPVKMDTGKNAKIVGSIVSIGADKNEQKPFFFTDFEIPSEFQFGQYQMSAVHNFHGGGRSVDLFGEQPHPIELSGELFNLTYQPEVIKTNGLSRPRHEVGETAMQRMQRLRQMCVKGARMLFQFHQFKFYVVVLDATFTAYHWNDVKYTLKLEVLDDNLDQGVQVSPLVAAKLNPPAHKSLLQQYVTLTKNMTQVLTKVTLATNTASAIITTLKRDPKSLLFAGATMLPGGVATVQVLRSAQLAIDAMHDLNNAIWPQFALDMTNAQPFETLDNEAYKKYLKPGAEQTQQTLNTAIAFFLNEYPKLRTASSSGPTLSPELSAFFARQGVQASANLGQITRTIDKIIKPVRSYTMVVKDPNLAKVALQCYNDATKWTVISDANGLPNMLNTGVYTLIIPYSDQIEGSGATLSPSSTLGT